MEIGPIPGIGPLPALKSPPADPRLSAVFDIEHSSEPGDDTYSGSSKSAADGQDDQEETTGQDEALEAEQPPENESQPGPSINLIA